MEFKDGEHDMEGVMCSRCGCIDLSLLRMGEFDAVLKALRRVIARSHSLCLDSEEDADTLFNRLGVALGMVSFDERDAPTEWDCPKEDSP